MRVFTLIFSLIFVTSLSHAASDPFQKMAKELVKGFQSKNKPRVALLTFPYHDGRVSSGSSILPERLTTYIASKKGVRVIERNLIKKLLEEQNLSETGVIDPKTAQQMGKVLGVDVIVTGTLIDVNDEETEVNARGIKAGTGEVVSASQALIKRFWSDKPQTVRTRRSDAYVSEPEEEQEPGKNEAIMIGIPGGRGGRGGGYYGR